jgi:hypothetical protein
MTQALGKRQTEAIIGLAGGLIIIAVFSALSAATASAQSPLTARELMENAFREKHRVALDKGEIVLINRPEEVTNTELNALMAMRVPADLKTTISELQRQASGPQTPGVLAIQEITTPPGSPDLSQAFEAVALDASEAGEAEALLQENPGKDYNLSAEEIALFRSAAGKNPTGTSALNAATTALKTVLARRYSAYRQKGLEGIPDYRFGAGKAASPADELVAATESIRLLKSRFPDYYRCLRFFPAHPVDRITHQFFWVKQMESGRPMFVLKHWLLDIQPTYGLITERHYYLSHSLNSLQVVIGCLPYGEGTLVILFNQVFTEKVNLTVGKRIAMKVGQSIVEKKVRPMFENLRTAMAP